MECEVRAEELNFVQGDTVKFLIYVKVGKIPKDLTNMTEAKVIMPKTDGSKLTKTFTASGGITIIGEEVAGVLQCLISKTESALVKAGLRQDWEFEFTEYGSQPNENVKVVQFLKSLNVSARV